MTVVAILIYFSPSLFFFEISSRFCPQVLPVTLGSGGVEVQSLGAGSTTGRGAPAAAS